MARDLIQFNLIYTKYVTIFIQTPKQTKVAKLRFDSSGWINNWSGFSSLSVLRWQRLRVKVVFGGGGGAAAAASAWV